MTLSHPSVPAHSIAPAYTGRMFTTPVPALRLPEESMDPEAAYRFIHDELMLDGSSRLNLATFVTTWMEPQATRLMTECSTRTWSTGMSTRGPRILSCAA